MAQRRVLRPTSTCYGAPSDGAPPITIIAKSTFRPLSSHAPIPAALVHQRERERAEPATQMIKAIARANSLRTPINKQREFSHDHWVDVFPGSAWW